MSSHPMTGEIHVWMPMIGFDREEADKGVGKLLERMSFTPNGVSAFLFHPDIVNQRQQVSGLAGQVHGFARRTSRLDG